jgi:hypothetical protein
MMFALRYTGIRRASGPGYVIVDVRHKGMSAIKCPQRSIRVFGGIWVFLAPIIFVMAAISTVRSETTYLIQLIAFSAVSLAGLVVGVGGLFRRPWAAFGMLILSWTGGVYFVGCATLLLLWPLIPGSEAIFHLLLLLLSLVIALPGVPFVVMARALRALTSEGVAKNEKA